MGCVHTASTPGNTKPLLSLQASGISVCQAQLPPMMASPAPSREWRREGLAESTGAAGPGPGASHGLSGPPSRCKAGVESCWGVAPLVGSSKLQPRSGLGSLPLCSRRQVSQAVTRVSSAVPRGEAEPPCPRSGAGCNSQRSTCASRQHRSTSASSRGRRRGAAVRLPGACTGGL